ncbi:MAG: polysaccharide biosynthesis/export family protein [Deltaproteobacteria bacterium]|nr:polysaccharide biosynthesis/export family protein [Deltaproteobacteria bacterium]
MSAIFVVLSTVILISSSGDLFPQEAFAQEYRIGAQDVLEITVIGFDDLNKRYRVSENGTISLPYLGDIEVMGHTKATLEKKLADLLKDNYLKDPQVTIVIVEFQSKKVYLIGAVSSPGPYDILGRLTLLKLIAQAGGLDADAGDEIIVMRQLPEGKKTSIKISVEDLIMKGDPELDIPLQPEDVVSIPVDKTILIYVTGQVIMPGALEVKESNIPTLLRAIAQAGGFSERASKGGVIIKRKDSSGKETRIKVNVNDIIKGKKRDVQLQENDVIIVSEKLF